jgi:two-component system phosphate regulon sensor histidine kinase PhoR
MSLRVRITLIFVAALTSAFAASGAYLLHLGITDSRTLATALVLGAAAGAALSYVAAGSIVRPIVDARNSVRQLARGGMPENLRVHEDEIGQLLEHFNTIASRLNETLEELRDEREKASAMLERMAEGIIVTDNDGRIVLFNRAAERIFNLPASRATGKTVTDVFLDYELSAMLMRALRQAVTQTGEVRIASTNSDHVARERILDVFVTRVETERGHGFGAVMVLHDLTEIRRLENIRRDFVANVSHELRTPIASIRAMTETLLMGAKDDPEAAQEFLTTVSKEAERLSVLLDDLLEVARIESGKREMHKTELDASELVETVVGKLRPQAESHGIMLSTSVPHVKMFHANHDAMQQILVNLIDNAIKYTPERGRVSVECEEAPEDTIKFIVRDTGVGIPRSDIPRIFERFYRVDKARSRELGGTGLGLSIVKHLVEAQGGDVKVESRMGQGSVFTVTLPRGVPETAAPNVAP